MSAWLARTMSVTQVIRRPIPDDSLFSYPSAMSDITLVVDGRNLHVSKCVLSLASPVFLTMFEGDFKDKKKIPLKYKKYEDMVELLLCIYPSTSKPITEANLDVVLPLADEYRIESLKVRCEDFVLNLLQLKASTSRYRDPSNEELVHYLYLADMYSLYKLIDACAETAKDRNYGGAYGIKYQPKFQLLSGNAKFCLLSARVSRIER